ncbi:ubiquitin-conjugating enzyme/RWD-like protein [Mycena latifolia]|nr:ubiquitin-conjugating enzyme/RWD-like protein [Mycena latifolia]
MDLPNHAEAPWNWELLDEQKASLDDEERDIWSQFLACRKKLSEAAIAINPLNWPTGPIDLRQWEAHLPGPNNTSWEGGVYSLHILFPSGVPDAVPKLRFIRPLFHVNIYPTGTWAFSTAADRSVVRREPPDTSVFKWVKSRQQDPGRLATLLCGIQSESLNNPNLDDPAQSDAYILMRDDPEGYERKIVAQADAWRPNPRTGLVGRSALQSITDG